VSERTKTHLASFRCRSRRLRREHICARLSSSYVGVQIGAQESEWMWMGKNGKVRQVGDKWGNTVGHELGSKCDEWRESIWVGVY